MPRACCLFIAGQGHRSAHTKTNHSLHAPLTVANRKLAFVQRWRLRRQRRQMLVTQLALPLCAAAAFPHGQSCCCYALVMQAIAKVLRLEGRFALLRVRPNPLHRGDAQKAAPFVHPSCQTLIWLLSVKRRHEFLCARSGDRYPLPDGERDGALGCHP